MNAAEEFFEQTESFIARARLLGGGETVLAAVSGGADSLALAEVLRRADRYHVCLGHVHHGLRRQADDDAAFVEDLARQRGAPFYLRRIDTPAQARRWGVGTEEAARRGRYEALAEIADEIGASAVAVAHHADDQVETVLHRIVRGTHLRGLAGMPARRPLRGEVALIRPLLWARRRQIEEFCRAAGLTWRTDHTNVLSDFTRNFIRNDLLPLLRERINVRADEALLRLAQAAGQAEAVLEELAGELFERARRRGGEGEVALRTAPLKKAPPLLAGMALRRGLEELSAPQQELSQERFNDLLEVLTGRLPSTDLPGGIRARREGHSIRLSRPRV